MSSRQAEQILRRKDDLHVANWIVRTIQDVGVLALTTWEPREYNVDIACLSEARIPDSGHSVIKAPCEEICFHLYHSGVVDKEAVFDNHRIRRILHVRCGDCKPSVELRRQTRLARLVTLQDVAMAN